MIAVPSGRSGGVVDDVVMDLSVGLQVPFQKNGAPSFRRAYREAEFPDAGKCIKSRMQTL